MEAHVSRLAGAGKVREEVWIDEAGQVVRYNLAFINHFICQRDNGRVLGYDTAHGYHHRHFMGQVTDMEFTGYEALVDQFRREYTAICKRREGP